MIEFQEVEKKYILGGEEWILGPLHFSIPASSSVCILGPSGSGKSTLLHLLGTLDSPNSGKILFFGKNISTFLEEEKNNFRNKYLGFVFQDFYLFPEFSVMDNIILPLDLQKNIDKEEKKERGEKILKEVGLSEKKNHFPNQLSGGQRQRVAIARALIVNPKLLLADEPTGNLDQKTGKKILDLLFSLAREKKMGFWCVTHDENIASQFDIILEMTDGKIEKITKNKSF